METVKAGWYSRRDKGVPVEKGVQPSQTNLFRGSPDAPPAPFPQGLEVKSPGKSKN